MTWKPFEVYHPEARVTSRLETLNANDGVGKSERFPTLSRTATLNCDRSVSTEDQQRRGMLYDAGAGNVRPPGAAVCPAHALPVPAVSTDERRRAAAALERLRAKLAEKEEWRRHGERVAALKDTLDSPLFAHVLALQRAVAQLRKQLSATTPERGGDFTFSANGDLMLSSVAPSPDHLQRWITAAAAGRPTTHVRLTRPPSGGLGFSVVGLHPGSSSDEVFIKHIQPGGVAHRDGHLQAWDQILVINGRPLEAGMSQCQALALLQQPGRTVEMVVARDRPPGEAPPKPLSSSSPHAATDDINTAMWGHVEEIQLTNDGSGFGFGIVGGKTAGVVVRTLVRGSVADRDGRLRTGDHILRIGDTPTDGLSSDEVVEVLRGCGSHVTVLVARDPCGQRTRAPPPPDSAPVSAVPVSATPPRPQRPPSKMPNLDGYEIHEVLLTKKDGQSLGISIVGHNPLSSQDAVGVFIKHVVPGSAAHHSGNIRVQDRLIGLDGVSLHGLSNREVVDVMKQTGRTVVLTLVRKKNATGERPLDRVESSRGSLRRSLEFKSHSADLDTHNTCSGPDAALKAKWQQALSPNYQVLVIRLHPVIEDDAQLQRSSKLLPVHTLRLGVELDSFDGHHYVSSVVPGGPVDKNGVLRPEDELLEVNDVQLYGKSRREVVSFLKEVPPPFTLVCCRQPTSDLEAERHGRSMGDLEMKLASALCSRASVAHEQDDQQEVEQVDVLNDGMCDATSAAFEEEEQDGGSEEEEGGELALWSSKVDVLELHKEPGEGLGFSILDYQDPLDPSGCAMVIRSLVARGAADRCGALLPGDRLVSVNGVRLERVGLRRAVDVLKGAPPGAVRLGVRKPLAGSAYDLGQGRPEEEEELILDAGLPPYAQTSFNLDPAWQDEEEGREMAVDDENEQAEKAKPASSPGLGAVRETGPGDAAPLPGECGDIEADSEVSLTDTQSIRSIDTEKRRRRSRGVFSAARRGHRELPEREDGEGEETPPFSHWGPPRRVEVRPEEGQSLGLSIVGGHHVIKRLRNGEELKGIFIKQVADGSPAARTRALKTGDKILQVSGVDLRAASHEEAVTAIKSAESPVIFVVQSLSANPRMPRAAPPPYRPPGQSEQEPTQARERWRDRYGDLRGEPDKEAHGGLGLSLAGNPDRSSLGVFVAGLRGGDRLLQVNDRVLDGRSHRKASATVKSSSSKVRLVLLRTRDGVRRMAVPPFPPTPECASPAEWPSPPDGATLCPPQEEEEEEDTERESADDRQMKNEEGAGDSSERQSRRSRDGDAVVAASDDIGRGRGRFPWKPTGSRTSSEPSACPVRPGHETTLEICKGRRGLGLSVVGGRDTRPQAIVILEVHEGGAAAEDGRLRPGDQILEVDGADLRRASHEEAVSALRRPSPKASVKVLRHGGRPGSAAKTSGGRLDVVGQRSGSGAFISEAVRGGAAEPDARRTQGGQILSVDGEDTAHASHQAVGAILKLEDVGGKSSKVVTPAVTSRDDGEADAGIVDLRTVHITKVVADADMAAISSRVDNLSGSSTVAPPADAHTHSRSRSADDRGGEDERGFWLRRHRRSR
ncbi:inaD-like protein isoform X3 [Phycodurus eques]|uniref:inaD-like protein isoform X3 n=1 Tax=Phycodurus eques TaxID=693459 RepID=UPI002ACE6EEE|nr:inaD-like protein isoform X3 [Phycodurus eques]